MKKKVTLLTITMVVCLAAVLAFTACTIPISVDSDDSAEGKEDSIALLKGLFEDTLSTSYVATAKRENVTIYTETSDGDKSKVEFQGTTAYALKDGENFVYLVDVGGSGYYYNDETYYNYYHPFVMNNPTTYTIGMLESIPEDGGTWTCATHMEGEIVLSSKKNKSSAASEATGTLVLTTEEGTLQVVVTVKDGLVEKCTMTMTGDGSTTTVTTTFSYENATFTAPSLENYTHMEGTLSNNG